MPRVNALFECVGLAVCEKARRQLTGDGKFGDVLMDVAKATLDYANKELAADDLRQALAEMAALNRDGLTARLDPLMDGLARVHALPFRVELREYLALLPGCVRRFLARPSDPTGKSIPDNATFQKPEDLLPFLPPHRPHLHATPAGLDGWHLTEPVGFGEADETWRATDPKQPGAAAALTFVVDAEARKAVAEQQQLFRDVFKLTDESGIVPLRSVYLETTPPAFDAPYLSGYDLASLMWDWKWRYDSAKPEAALKVMKRLCDIVAAAHAKGIVHRDLKPANVRLHPTDGGKFTVWVANFGWGQIASARSLQLSKGTTPRGEQLRLALRGAHTALYASPQQTKKEAPDPRDDVHALGVIWYQLLKRDPHAAAPFGTEWAEAFAAAGVTDSQARLLSACLSTRPEKRPENAARLGEFLASVATAPAGASDGSKLIPIKGKSSEYPTGWDTAPAAGGSKSQAPLSGKHRLTGPASGKIGKQAAVAVAAMSSGLGHGGLPKLVNNSVGMTFALIPPGTFEMGSEVGEAGRREHEGPRHTVAVTKPFYLSVFPVTQEQYEKVKAKNPSAFTKAHGGGPDHPVEGVPWDGAVAFCERLSRSPDEQMHARAYRLPTEAEWEFACRAGTTTAFSCGDKFAPTDGHYAAAGVLGKSGGEGRTAAVGHHPPNALGLHDLHGNVQEWCADWYDEYYYFDSPAKDPQGPPTGTLKVVRGGCWTMFGNDCRSAARRGQDPASPGNSVGFRVVLTVG